MAEPLAEPDTSKGDAGPYRYAPDDAVNNPSMDAVREKYEVLDRIIKNVQYDGKAVQAEAWEAFVELRGLRMLLDIEVDVHTRGLMSIRDIASECGVSFSGAVSDAEWRLTSSSKSPKGPTS